jgi:hypothetical protein
MKRIRFGLLALATLLLSARAQERTVPVTVENFIRAETDFYFGKTVKDGGRLTSRTSCG